ncbi:MAG: RDD family protein [Gemmatimonadota bacterium]|jgi:uncharacterized RDD family membrane protein YckC
MAAPSNARDPRSVITPEAFHVSPELLGTPLATPGRRFAAILVDLVCIGILTAVTRSFALVLGVVIAIALVRASTRRTEVEGNVFDRARRFSIGCLGVGVGLLSLGIWAAVTFGPDVADDLENLGEVLDEQGVAVDLGDNGQITVGLPSDNDSVATAPEEPVEIRDVEAVRDGVSLYTAEEALDAYVELRREGVDDPMDEELLDALEARLAREFASDTLAALENRITVLQARRRAAQAQLREAEEQLDEAESGGILSWVRSVFDDLGFGFGWAALYTTVLLSVTNGQTLGKRLLGIRVLRLDGRPINWWIAFERAGGYAAGFATGLLGFAQVYWDANRQAIHDRIVGTVVVMDGAAKVTDWESAL